MNKIIYTIFISAPLLVWTSYAHAQNKGGAILKFSDGRESLRDLKQINDVLLSVGVFLERIDVPKKAVPLLKASMNGPLTKEDKNHLLELFSLSRQEVLSQISKAGRAPVMADGGNMTSGEIDVPPYPKVYDLSSLSASVRITLRNKFGRLHVNLTDDMVGVDEVMTLPSGGPWTWYYQIKNNVVVELNMSEVKPGNAAWRLSYPGLTPHGAYFHSERGLCIAYITGPKTWNMRYEAPQLTHSELLGKNPFINFNEKSSN